MFVSSVLLGVAKFMFIFPTQFYKGRDMAEDSHIGRNIAQTNEHCPASTVRSATVGGPDELNPDSLWKDNGRN